MAVMGDGLAAAQAAEKVGVWRQTPHAWLATRASSEEPPPIGSWQREADSRDSCALLRSRLMRPLKLEMVQLRVDPVERQQLLMGAVFGHHAILDDDDPIGVAQSAQTMGDGDDGAARHQPL